ncbi:MAG: 7-carboxy-7-deazaguanine synthase [Pseudomonadales bacterium]|jgi:7-carboxy-7-deazaguanine synthase (Cx14CxxC type)
MLKPMYSVKEIFYTLQGEGRHAGRPAVFCRFAGCNLWTGSEARRASSLCNFCDTDFVGVDGHCGGRYNTAAELVEVIEQQWPEGMPGHPLVVLTGGEPMLQLDEALINALHDEGFEIALETNGTIPVPESVDWICVSPKGEAKILQTSGQELKLVYPQHQAMPEQFAHLDFDHFYLQPMDTSYIATSSDDGDYVQQAIEYCLLHPQWHLSLQTHKITGIL